MKLFTKLVGVFLLIAFAAQAVATEEITAPALPAVEERIPGVEYKKTILYGSLSPCPGVGVSMQTRHDHYGTALDVKFGVLVVLFNERILTGDYNFLYFMRAKKQSFYGSCGIGVAARISPSWLLPRSIYYIPLRAGFHFGGGFVDIGAQMLNGRLAIPEVRAGFSF